MDGPNSDTELTTSELSLLNANAAVASFAVPSYPGDTELYFKLTVTDQSGNSASSRTTFVVKEDQTPVLTESTPVSTPTNNATPQVNITSVDRNVAVTYEGSCTGNITELLANDETTVTLSKDGEGEALDDGEYTDCKVIGTTGNGSSAELTLTSFTVDTIAPIVNAVATDTENAGEAGALDGSRSTDTGGSGIVSYAWTQVDDLDSSGAPDAADLIPLDTTNPAIARFTLPSVAAEKHFYFKLTVTDNAGNSASEWADYQVFADTRPIVSEVPPVATYTNDTTPDVVITSNQTGQIIYGGSCEGLVTEITQVDTNTTLTLLPSDRSSEFSEGTYSDCTIAVDNTNTGVSQALTLTAFTVDTTAPTFDVAASGSATTGATGTLTGSTFVETGSGIKTYAWVQVTDAGGGTQVSSGGVQLSNADTFAASFTVPGVASADSLFFKLTVTDNADNAASKVVEYSIDADVTAPVVSNFSVSTDPANSDTIVPATTTFSVVVTFSESMDTDVKPALGFDPSNSDVTSVLQNATTQEGTWSDGTVANDTYTVTYTVNNSVQVNREDIGIIIGAAFMDAAGNPHVAETRSNAFNIALDTTATTVISIERDTPPDENTNVSSVTFAVTFSEAIEPTSFVAADDLELTKDPSSTFSTAAISDLQTTDKITFKVTVTGLAGDGVLGLSLASGAITGADGNAVNLSSAPATNETYNIEAVPPALTTVTIASDNANDTTQAIIGDVITLTFTASEPLSQTSGETPVVTIAGQTATVAETQTANQYQATITVDTNTTAGVVTFLIENLIDSGGLAGNDVTAVTDTSSVTIDTVRPTVSRLLPSATDLDSLATTFSVVVKFSEPMDTNQTPILTFDPDVSDVLQDVATKTGSWSNDTFTNDTYTVTYTVLNANVNRPDISVIISTDFKDAAGNPLEAEHTATNAFNIEQDTTTPTLTTVTIVSDNPNDTTQATIGDVITLTFTASEALSQTSGETPVVTIAGQTATVAETQTANQYQATITVDENTTTGLATFLIGSLIDSNGLTGSDVAAVTDGSSVTIDTVPPTVVITAPAEARGSFTATFTFTEGVTLFELADITVGNGTASDFTGAAGQPVYTATITPTEHGTVTLDVAAGVAEDDPGNPNTAAEQVTVNFIDENYVRQRTQRIISNFMTRRGDAIVSNQPDFTERLNQGGGGAGGSGASFSGEGGYSNNRMAFASSLRQVLNANKAKKSAQVTELGEMMKLGLQSKGTQSLGFRDLATNDGAPAGFDIWVRGRWARYEDDTNAGDLGLLFIGADYKFNDGLVIGLVAQFDWTDENNDTDDFKIDGRGWMIGPYMVAQLHQNLIFDANFSWGQSDNEVSPFNTYTDSFEGTRWLASAKFTGSFQFGQLHVAPHLGVMYFQERQDAYVDSLSIDIPSQTVKLGRLTFGPKFSTTIKRKDGTTISPYLGVKGLWDFERTEIVDLTTGIASESTDGVRTRVDAGVSIRLPDGLTLNGEGFYDGIGANNYKSYGGSIRLSIPLQRDSSAATMKLGIKPDEAAGLTSSSTNPSSRGVANSETSSERK